MFNDLLIKDSVKRSERKAQVKKLDKKWCRDLGECNTHTEKLHVNGGGGQTMIRREFHQQIIPWARFVADVN